MIEHDTGVVGTKWDQCINYLLHIRNVITAGPVFSFAASVPGVRVCCSFLWVLGTLELGRGQLFEELCESTWTAAFLKPHLPAFLLARLQPSGLSRGSWVQLALVHMPGFLGRTVAALLRSEACRTQSSCPQATCGISLPGRFDVLLTGLTEPWAQRRAGRAKRHYPCKPPGRDELCESVCLTRSAIKEGTFMVA